ncbi:MAG: hypothetical protein OEY56_00540 [Cyclobacteriaceae bacterium]|nr:hypothetical protein [Cyclobacteriaceae bacterium]
MNSGVPKILLFAFLLVGYARGFSQGMTEADNPAKEKSGFINEYMFALNRTDVQDVKTKNLTGFGFGLYHRQQVGSRAGSALSGCCKRLDLILGVEYNRTNQLQYDSAGSSVNEYTVGLANIDFPLGLRFNLGLHDRLGMFLEGGFFVNWMIAIKDSRGSFYSGKPDGYAFFPGPYTGLGLVYVAGSSKIIVKTDYKWSPYTLYHFGEEYADNKYVRIVIALAR